MLTALNPQRARARKLSSKLAKYEFVLRVIDALRVPPYMGNTLRGGFGHVFRQVACVAKDNPLTPFIKGDECKDCMLRHSRLPSTRRVASTRTFLKHHHHSKAKFFQKFIIHRARMSYNHHMTAKLIINPEKKSVSA